MSLLAGIKSSADVKHIPERELPALAEEIRQRIIGVTSQNGGHVGPNLGVVELTIALHRVFNTPKDKITFDVSHQGYVHKLLTGRNGEEFDRIRMTGGLSGFLNREESADDAFGAGHAGTALSAAVGMAVARDRMGTDEDVVAVVGDAAFTCGVTMEALNNASEYTKRLIVVLNDNEWSISQNVGAIARYFNELITTGVYNKIDRVMRSLLKRTSHGRQVLRLASKWKRGTKDFLVSSSLFETYGFRYLGPVDGHDIDLLVKYLNFAKTCDQPVFLHVRTQKGRGYDPAVAAPEKFHGTSPFDVETGRGRKKQYGEPLNYQDVFGQSLLKYAKSDSQVIGITAAMPPGTGLVYMREDCPEQFFDVGIAEEHAVLFAAGMATKGFKPVVAIYSTFLQRAYDMIMHDVCLQNLPVVFCMDRAGLSANDGATHHGLFDIAYLRCLPNTTIAQPKDEDELSDLLWTALNSGKPFFIRYPKGAAKGISIKETPNRLPVGKAEVVRAGSDISFWALGPSVDDALVVAEALSEEGISVEVVNARFAKPLDRDLLLGKAQTHRLIVTLEDHVRTGGFGSAVLECLEDARVYTPVKRIGWPDEYIGHASTQEELRAQYGLDVPALTNAVREAFKRL
ncbi:MAG: 1-deoxy-D-xylulose-5-phosphate synthase [Opitutales bacterium]|nr:1-deoxy-D-xylulose-5-phosphate synthase [Opitutales bacterium]